MLQLLNMNMHTYIHGTERLGSSSCGFQSLKGPLLLTAGEGVFLLFTNKAKEGNINLTSRLKKKNIYIYNIKAVTN